MLRKVLKIIFNNPFSLIQSFFRFCENVFLYSRKFNINENVVLYYGSGRYNDFFLPIYQELKKSKIPVKLLIRNLNPEWYWDPRFDINDTILLFNLNNGLKKAKKIIFVTTGGFPKCNYSTKILYFQINHGFGSLGGALNEDYFDKPYNTFFVANTEFQVYQLKNYYAHYINEENILPYGYPKLDGRILKNNQKEQKKIKTIFYGPSYHIELSSIFTFLEPLVEFCKKNGVELIIKLHPMLFEYYDLEKSGGIKWEQNIKEYQKLYPKIKLLEKNSSFDEVCKYFKRCDLFLTDNSGLGFEFSLITGKPCGFLGSTLKVPLENVRESNYNAFVNYPEQKYRGVIGPLIEKPEELGLFLNNLKLKDFDYQLKKFKETFTFNLGGAAPVIVEKIVNILHEKD